MTGSRAPLQLAIGAVLISFSPVLVVLANVGPTIIAFYRMSFGGVVLLFIAWTQGARRVPRLRHVIAGGVTGGLVAMDLAVWHRSIEYIGPGLATVLGNFQVFFLAAFGVLFLGERVTRRLAFAIPVAVIGLLFVFGFEEQLASADYRLGIFFGMATAILYAAYLIVLRRTRVVFSGEPPAATVAMFTVTAAVVLGISGVIEGESFTIPDTQTWLALIGLGLLPQVVGWLLISGAIAHVETSRAGLLLLLQPSLAFVWDVVFFGRETSAVVYMGVALALGGIYFGMGGGRQPTAAPKAD